MRRNTRFLLSFLLILILSSVLWLRFEPVAEPQNFPEEKSLESVSGTRPAIPIPDPLIDIKEVQDFQSWISEFRGGNRGAEFLQQGLLFAEARRPSMLHFIRTNSSAALEAAIGFADYAALPENIRALVEEPFTTTGDVQVTAICDHDDHTPQYHVNVYLEDTTRFRIGHEHEARTGLSKLDVPIQGIELDGWAALESSVFERVEGADADWAHTTLPIGNPDPELDFLTGEELGPNPVTTVAGGFVFSFSNEETLAELEQGVRGFDELPGKYTGSSVIYSEEVQEVQAKGFPIHQIQDSQLQLSINDTTGDKTSLFIRVIFSDKPDAPISKADLEAQINGPVSDAFVDFSYNQTSMAATVTDTTYQVSMVSTEYAFTGGGDSIDESGLFDEAVALYQVDVPGDPYNTYDIVGVVFPKIDGVGWAGLGTVGGANSRHWLNGVASTETIVHEFGHNYGLSHSNYWVFNSTNAASTNPVDPTGVNEEYGDFWDVMGDGDVTRGHFHMAAKRYLSWLDANQFQQIDEAGDSGTYRVFRFDHKDSTGLQGLEIRKAADENYFVGFRRAFESNDNYYNGAYILWERPGSGGGDPSRNHGWIIDTTPESPAERQDAGISLGRTYSDLTAQVHITPIEVGGTSPDEYLDVVVNYGEFAGNNAPTVSITAPGTGNAREAIEFSASGNDGDGDTVVYSWDLGNGDVYPSTSSISASFTVGGTYTVAVTVTDMKGGTETKTAQVVIDDPVNTWSNRTSGTGDNLTATAANSTHVVVGGQSTLLRSSDGQSWTNVTPSSANNVAFNDIVWAGSEFVAVGRDAEFQNNSFFGWKPVVYTSPDGNSWTEEFAGPASAGESLFAFNKVASNADGSLVITVGDKDLVYKRVDGGDWTVVDSLALSQSTSLGIGFGSGVFVLGGFDFVNQSTGLYLFRTADGVNWEDLEDNSDLNQNAGLDTIAFFDDIFMGSGFNSRVVFSENGGISWQTLEQGNRHSMSTFAFGKGVFYSIGVDEDAGGSLINLVSSDGKLWTEVDDSVEEGGNDIIIFNNSFIIVADGGSIRQSGLVNAAEEILGAPVIAPSGQEFGDSINVTISTTSQNAEIRYTLDGSEPTAGSTLYSGAINITATTTVKAKVFKTGLAPGPAATETYTKGALTGFDAWIDAFDVGSDTAASDNPDGDWATNLFEWVLGSLPDDVDSAPDAPELSFNGAGKAVFIIHRLSKSTDVTISIEKSTDMINWQPISTTMGTNSNTLLRLTTVPVIDTYPCFLRIKAED